MASSEIVSFVISIAHSNLSDLVQKTIDIVEKQRSNAEYIIVANGLQHKDIDQLTDIVLATSDATLHVVPDRVSYEFAVLIGLDNCFGSEVYVVDLQELDAAGIQHLINTPRKGNDLVQFQTANQCRTTVIYAMCVNLFLGFYRLITGIKVSNRFLRSRVLSRAATNFMLNLRDAEMSFKYETLAPTLCLDRQEISAKAYDHNDSRGFASALAKAYRVLHKTTALPLRGAIGLAVISAGLNCIYIVYVLGSYFIRTYTAEGWTMLSLQVSGMFFLLSIILAILGEVLISIDKVTNRRFRYYVQREIRSPLSRIHQFKNITLIEPE